jgi:CubicO group peptidase (beta-lactamase class C family)
MRLFNRSRSRGSRKCPRPRRLLVESLGSRDMLAGLVIDQSVFDVDLFAQNIEWQIPVDTTGPDGVVGYSYAIIDGDPDNPIAGAGGNRRMAWDTPIGIGAYLADPSRPQEIASISKAITGSAIMHLLQQQIIVEDPGLNSGELTSLLELELDRPIVNHLPGTWGPGNPAASVNNWTPFFNTITVRELLTHTSGLLGDTSTGGVVTGPAGASAYTYAGLQLIAEGGIVNVNSPTDPTWAADYWTNNFAWFRVMLPYMWNEIDNDALDATAIINLVDMSELVQDDGLAADLANAIEDDWGIEPLAFDVYSIGPDQLTASIYKYYVSEYILKPSGVEDPQTKTTGVGYTLLYPLDPTIVPGSAEYGPLTLAQQTGQNTDDLTLQAGSRGWNLSAIDVARFLTGVRHGAIDGTPILADETLALMDAQGLGWQHSTNSGYVGDFGQYHGHNGINFAPTNLTPNAPVSIPANAIPPTPPTLADANNTVAIAFPNGVEAALLINSQIQSIDGPTQPVNAATPFVIGGAFNPGGVGTGTTSALRNAYDNAWSELVYDGYSFSDVANVTNLISSADDTFTVRTNPTDPAYIDIVHSAIGLFGSPFTVATITRRADTLQKLTINGLDGANEFRIEALPATLELVINGGFGSDSVTVGRRQFGTINIDNLGEYAPGLLRFDGNGGNDSLELTDGLNTETGKVYEVWNDEVTRSGSGPGPREYHYEDVEELTLRTSFQSEVILVQSTNAGTTTTINSLAGADDIQMFASIAGPLNIAGGTATDSLRIFDVFTSTPRDYLFETNLLTLNDDVEVDFDVEVIELYAGSGGDTITVDGLAAAQSLLLDGNFGNDEITIHPGRGFIISVLGYIEVIGDVGSDTLNVNDFGYLAETDYHVMATSVSRTGMQSIHYETIEALNVQGGLNGNEYFIAGTSAATTVSGRNQADAFAVGVSNLDGINASLTIVGEDTVFFQDIQGTNLFYGIDDNRLFGFGFAGIELYGIELATLNASSLDNQIFVENAPGDTRFVVNGNGGDDTITLAAVSRNLLGFDTPLVVNGGSGDDHLILHDESSGGSLVYSVTENSIDRLLFGERSLFNTEIGVTFSSMTDVELHMNDYSSIVNVQSTNPATEYIFHGNEGTDTLNLNRHVDDTTDANILIDGPDITGEKIDIQYYQFEQLNVNLGDENTQVRVEELNTDADLNLGAGNDHVFVTPTARNLSNIDYAITVDGQGGRDQVILHDENYNGNAHYTVTYDSVDRLSFGPLFGGEPGLRYKGIELVRLFMTAHDDVADINSTNLVTEYDLHGRRGNDTFNVNLPPLSPVTLRGGNGTDAAHILGTAAGDEISVSLGPGSADLNLVSIENASFDGLGGTDVLAYEGIAGVNEDVSVQSSTTAHHGALLIVAEDVESSALHLAFESTEILDLLANPDDIDAATFFGTNQADRFEINLAADGTNADRVLQLFGLNGEAPLLSLRDYRNFGALGIAGGDGADAFNVHVAPHGPGTGRDLSIDGGGSSGTDVLTVHVQRKPKPNLEHEHDNQTGSGMFEIDYDAMHRFFIAYTNVEKAKAKSVKA